MNVIKPLEYPVLEINLTKLEHNVKAVAEICMKSGINLTGVVKGFNAIPEAIERFISAGCGYIGTSRIQHIIQMKENGLTAKTMLIRIPMLSETEMVVQYADVSLNSELTVLEKLNKEAEKQGKTHGVVLMADLGDLREGFWDKDEMVRAAVYVENSLKNLILMGVGVNLGCYGSIKPTVEKMDELCAIAEGIETRINRKLEIISGGATSSFPLVLEGKIPKRINDLRIGEGIILARDLKELWGLDMSFLYQDVFTLKAEIVEIKEKPTHPVGEIFIDGFGNRPVYEDKGIRRRAILGMGKLDYALNDKIIPRMKGFEVIGASSDHMIVDIEDNEDNLKVGDLVSFDICYPAMMYLTNTKYVRLQIV